MNTLLLLLITTKNEVYTTQLKKECEVVYDIEVMGLPPSAVPVEQNDNCSTSTHPSET